MVRPALLIDIPTAIQEPGSRINRGDKRFPKIPVALYDKYNVN
jgi:hypothetical protein